MSPTFPLLPPPPLSSGSPSAHPQLTICLVRAPRVCQSPSSAWLGNPLPPTPASESWTPPRPIDPAAPPWFLAPSGSALVCRHPSSPRDSTPRLRLVPLSLWLCQAPPSLRLLSVLCRSGSTTAFRIPASASVI